MSLVGYNLRPALRIAKRKPLAVPLVLAAPFLPPHPLPAAPIFLIGSARSGTTLLFELLREARGVAHLGEEGHMLWESFHHPRDKGWDQGPTLGPEDIRWFERRFIGWSVRLLAGAGRFMDKTPTNVFRLPYLQKLFPDATYLFILRDGRAIVSSMCVVWRTWPQPWYRVSDSFRVDGMKPGHWRLDLVPGWRELNGKPVEEVAARQYTAAMEGMLPFREQLDPRRRVDIRYEDVLADPVGEVGRVLDTLQLPFTNEHRRFVSNKVRPADPQKWRTRTYDEVERILPKIHPMLVRTGYA